MASATATELLETSATTPSTSRAPARRFGVILVDPLPVVRAGLVRLLADQPELAVLADVGTADEALDAIEPRRAEKVVVLVGLNLEGDDSYWLMRTIRERFPSFTILACGARAEPIAISRALFMGADGFVDKNVDPAEFVSSVKSALAGELVLAGPPKESIPAIADGIENRREVETRLTRREREVLNVAAEGLTAREIAERLGVRERTITTHLGRIYGKLGVGSRVAAIRAATDSGLVSVGARE
jgi:DNA-binding NarL/FixJ family response regulator